MAAERFNWEVWHPEPVSTAMERIDMFHVWVFWITVAITVLVFALLLYASWRFSEKRNKTPSKTTHNTIIEVLWTAVPVMILIVIAIPSYKLLYYVDRVADADMTLKVTGHQWYWSYEYPDYGNFTFDANLIPEADLKPGQKRLLDTDNRVVLPTNTKIRLQFTSADVIHSWGVNMLGIKMDAEPGRLNETWVQITKPGVYYGFCSEICGTNHAFMPIAIEAVTPEKFKQWVETAKAKFARADEPAAPAVAATDVPAAESNGQVRLAQTKAGN